MSTFHSMEMRKAAKDHVCEQCRKPILKGTVHRRCAQVWEGEFHSYREHIECFEAWDELNFTVRDLYPNEGAAFLAEDHHEPEDRDWLCEAHPVVADRLGWSSHSGATA